MLIHEKEHYTKTSPNMSNVINLSVGFCSIMISNNQRLRVNLYAQPLISRQFLYIIPDFLPFAIRQQADYLINSK